MSEQEAGIVGKVARVVSSRELIINRGADDGVAEGMIFKVLDHGVGKIKDPDTSEVLGEVKRVKVVVRISEVAPRFAVARTFRVRRVNVGGAGLGAFGSLDKIFSPPKYEYSVETLERSPDERELPPDEALIEVGDLVESLSPGESEEDIPSIAVWR